MSDREIPCPKCGGTGTIPCTWCHGQGGWSETSGGETTWHTCTYCQDGKTHCDNGCIRGTLRVWD